MSSLLYWTYGSWCKVQLQACTCPGDGSRAALAAAAGAGCRCACSCAALHVVFGVLFSDALSYMLMTRSGCAAQVQASFFGVGAPEAVLVGLVALVIFGPQGLAEVLLHVFAGWTDFFVWC